MENTVQKTKNYMECVPPRFTHIQIIEWYKIAQKHPLVFYGAMGSEKSAALLLLHEMAKEKYKHVVAMKPVNMVIDRKPDQQFDLITTRSIGIHPIAAQIVYTLEQFGQILREADAILIDEFWGFADVKSSVADMKPYIDLLKLFSERGGLVVITTLDYTWQGNYFVGYEALSNAKDIELVYMTAICYQCGSAATRSKRISTSTDLFEIPKDAYVPACEPCFRV